MSTECSKAGAIDHIATLVDQQSVNFTNLWTKVNDNNKALQTLVSRDGSSLTSDDIVTALSSDFALITGAIKNVRNDVDANELLIQQGNDKIDALEGIIDNVDTNVVELKSQVREVRQQLTDVSTTAQDGEDNEGPNSDSLEESDSLVTKTLRGLVIDNGAAIETIAAKCDLLKNQGDSCINSISAFEAAVATEFSSLKLDVSRLIDKVEELDERFIRLISEVETYAKDAAADFTKTLLQAAELKDVVSGAEGICDSINELKDQYFNIVTADVMEAKYSWIIKLICGITLPIAVLIFYKFYKMQVQANKEKNQFAGGF